MKSQDKQRLRRRPFIAEGRQDPATTALSRAIMLAHVLRWREEWLADMARRQRAKANGQGGSDKTARSSKQAGDGQFAESIARKEFGRFYWSGKPRKP